jgi:ubiquinone biosynthesis protein
MRTRDAGRTARPLSLMWRGSTISFLLGRHATRFALRWAGHRLRGHGSAASGLLGQSITELTEALGAAFIKIGQILSSRPDLLPHDIVASLARLQDQVEPFDSELVPGLLEHAFGRRMEDVFESFELIPFASASIATVHRARLRSGQDVAVKIRRPGVAHIVRRDLQLIRALAKTASRLPGLRLMPLEGLVDEFGRALCEQLDFELEAANLRRFHHNLAGFAGVRIPRLVEHLCTDSVITMEYLEDLVAAHAVDFPIEERREAAILGLHALYHMVFVDGLVHGDLHPGNIFFRRGAEVVLLDMGMVARLDAADQDAFTQFFYAMATNNGQKCARILTDTATHRSKSFDPEAFTQAIFALVSEYSAKNALEFEVASFAYRLFDLQRRSGLCGSTNFTMTIMSFVVFQGIVKQLYPDLDFQAEARRFLIGLPARSEQLAQR